MNASLPNRTAIRFALLALLLATPGVSNAGGPPEAPPGPPPGGPPPGGGPPGGAPPLGPREWQQLDLTEPQQDQLDELDDLRHRDQRAISKQLRSTHAQLRLLWQDDVPDAAAIDAKLDELGALHTRMARREAAFRLNVLELLTPEQRVRLRELDAQHPPPPDARREPPPAIGAAGRD